MGDVGLELVFELANRACDLEEQAKTNSSASLRKQASEAYSQAIQFLLDLRPQQPSPTQRGIASELIELLLHRLSCTLNAQQPSSTRSSSVARSPTSRRQQFAPISAEQDERRKRITKEIVDTEKSYLHQLRRLREEVQVPLLDARVSSSSASSPTAAAVAAASFSEDEDQVCFAGLGQITELSLRMLQAFQGKLEAWDANKTTLGDTFCLYSSFLKMYIPYANHFQRAQAILATKAQQYHLTADWQSLCIAPIQRIPRYVLLVKELIKYTPPQPEHCDAGLLESALKELSAVAQHINDRLQSSELEAKVFEIQSSLWSATGALPELVAPGRAFRKQGAVAKVRSNGQIKRNYYLFAFNDLVVYCTTNPVFRNKYHFHNALDFYGAFACDEHAEDRLMLQGKLKYGECAFKITGSNGYRVFVCQSAAERQAWLEALQSSATEKEEKRRSWGRAARQQQQLSPLQQQAYAAEEEDEYDGD